MSANIFEELAKVPENKSLGKKYLTKELYEKLKDTKTKLGGNLAIIFKSGLACPQSSVGVYATDVECYDTFSELFDNIIADYHGTKAPHPDESTQDMNLTLPDLDPSGEIIKSTRIRVARNLQGYPFCVNQDPENLQKVENVAKEAFGKMPDDLGGKYNPWGEITDAQKAAFKEKHFFFENTDSCLEASGCYENWPTGRGIYTNKAENFIVWVGEEDHLRIMSMQKGGNVQEVYDRLRKGLQTLSSNVPFAMKKGLGYVGVCPTNVGSGLRASVHIQLNEVSKIENFKEICKILNMQVRGTGGEHTAAIANTYDVSNSRRYGYSVKELISDMVTGVRVLVALETGLRKLNSK